ncbi:proline-rich protein 2-like [Vidua chalybeata]|uniref:proline-rich protein 2-like n=1 Tax=Vidua chalybeata TaxID=81927 RepID=UPI0023A7B58C|nr:proline-rich protein 2-like [Vidua chalybeata]
MKKSKQIPPALRGSAGSGGSGRSRSRSGSVGLGPSARPGAAPPARGEPGPHPSTNPAPVLRPRDPSGHGQDPDPKPRSHCRSQPRFGPGVRGGNASDGPGPIPDTAELREAGPGLSPGWGRGGAVASGAGPAQEGVRGGVERGGQGEPPPEEGVAVGPLARTPSSGPGGGGGKQRVSRNCSVSTLREIAKRTAPAATGRRLADTERRRERSAPRRQQRAPVRSRLRSAPGMRSPPPPGPEAPRAPHPPGQSSVLLLLSRARTPVGSRPPRPRRTSGAGSPRAGGAAPRQALGPSPDCARCGTGTPPGLGPPPAAHPTPAGRF